MNLFEHFADPSENLLPADGIVNYHGVILTSDLADQYFNLLLDKVAWRHDEAVIYGKKIITRRKVAWYGDHPFKYTYSKVTKSALPWIDELTELKVLVEKKTGETFNSCLLNLYHSGDEGMAWHSDAEKDLVKDGAIGSLSFGAERRFSFKHNTSDQVINVNLQHGGLLIMKGTTQTYWKHRLPPSKRVTKARVNLTFRTIRSSVS